MTDDTTELDRRRVLQGIAAGTAAVAGVSGLAAADHTVDGTGATAAEAEADADCCPRCQITYCCLENPDGTCQHHCTSCECLCAP